MFSPNFEQMKICTGTPKNQKKKKKNRRHTDPNGGYDGIKD